MRSICWYFSISIQQIFSFESVSPDEIFVTLWCGIPREWTLIFNRTDCILLFNKIKMKTASIKFQLHTNQLDSYSLPPAESSAPGYQSRRPSTGLRPPSGSYGAPPPSGSYGAPPITLSYGPPSNTYLAPSNGLGIQHGSVTGNLKQWPSPHLHPPRQPVAFRPPVPAGLIESIGHSVQHQDSFGIQLPPQSIYLPPPTGKIA